MLEKSTALLSLAALLASACTAEEPTEIVGGVMTQIKVPEYLKSVGVLIQVEGKNKFLAQLGQFRGSRALRITRMCQQIEAKDAAAGERK